MGGKHRLRQPPLTEPGQNPRLCRAKWVPIRDFSYKRTTSIAGGTVRGRWIRLPAFRWKAVRRKPVFALVLPTCHRHVGFEWVRIPFRFLHQQKGHHLLVMSFLLAKNPNNDTADFGCTPFYRWGAFTICGVHFICQRCTPGRRHRIPAVITAFSVKSGLRLLSCP